jgi:hypothetical protein
MTYPDSPESGLVSTGAFTEKGKKSDAFRQRLAGIASEWFIKCQSDRIRQERQWYLNYAFFTGNQHVQFKQIVSTGAYDLYVPKAPYYRSRPVINQIRRVVRRELSRLTAQKPNATILPSSSEDIDIFAAQAGEQIWESLWRRSVLDKTILKAVFWQTVAGTGYLKSYWDASKYDTISKVNGDICIESINPFHIFVPDLMQEELELQPYVIQAQVWQNSKIRQTFKVEPSENKYGTVDESLQNVMGTNRNVSKKEQSVILEVWVKPGYLPELPNGGTYTVVGDKLVQGFDHWPYSHGMYPYAKLDAIPSGKYYTTSVIEDLIPLQRELNRTRGQIIEAKNRMAKPQLTAAEGSIEAARVTSEPGLVIFHKLGFDPPQPLPMQNLPNYVTEEVNRLYTDISDISGQHEVSNGSTPPGVTAATAISFLQEQDETMIAPHYRSIEQAIEKTAKMSLTYAQDYWDEPRTVKVVGLDGSFDVKAFKGSNLRDNTDIRVEAGSALPTSRAARQAFIMDLMKMGFITPQEGLQILEVGGMDSIYERIQIDTRQAQRENMKMQVITEEDMKRHAEEFAANNPEAAKDVDSGLALEPPPIVTVHTWDNHEKHIEIHNNYRKSQNFENASPFTKALFEEHVRMHEEAAANMMVHPLTGMDPSDPNAPDPQDEQAMMDQMQQEQSGPMPMPELQGEETA